MKGIPFSSVVEVLRERASDGSERPAYTFLGDGEVEAESLTWVELDRCARALGGTLQALGLKGQSALLLYPSGLGFVTAFFGCLYGGVVAVPAYPPSLGRSQPRLRAITRDVRPGVVLATSALQARAEALGDQVPELRGLRWLATDGPGIGDAEAWRDPGLGGGSPAFLQYTSGSTAAPKGVMVSHANLLHNADMIQRAFGQDERSVVVGWLPLYHDMGLIGNVLQPLWSGGRCVLMSPAAFLQRPRRWLEAVSRYGATTSGGPNFAYDLCVRRIRPEERPGLDLSTWRLAFNGAEPVRAETLERFAEAFAPCGFRREAFYPCYGLAEATLFVAGGTPGEPPRTRSFQAAALERHEVAPEAGGTARLLASCGRPWMGQRVVIVDPEAGTECPPERVGEIWVSGPSVAQGYWERPEETARDFGATLAGGEGPFLRTGDLGFFRDGELFVTGRLKDLIILRGRNCYPQDLELAAEQAHPALRPGCGAAFSVDSGGEEQLVLVCEVERHAAAGTEEIAAAVRRALAEDLEVQVRDLVLVRAGTIPKTSSGKIQRRACRDLYLSGGLALVGRSALDGGAETTPAQPGLRDALADERQLLVQGFLRRTVARLARVDPERIGADQPLTAYGLDSLAAAELQAAVEDELGVTIPMAELLEGISLREAARRAVEAPRAAGRAAEHGPALSWGQRSLWVLHRLSSQSAAYNLAGAARVLAGPGPEGLRRALQALVDRHPALRTTYLEGADGPAPVVPERADLALLRADASGWSREELERRIREEAFRPFDLERGPVFRAALFEGAAGGDVLVVAVHHIAADFASFTVLARELGALVSGEALPAPPWPAAEAVRRQEAVLAGPRGEELWEWWRNHLAGVPALDLPTDRPRPPVQTFRGGTRTCFVETEPLTALAQGRGATPFMVLLAVFAGLLARTGGQEDFVVGTPTAGRVLEGLGDRLAGTVGYLVQPVPLRSDLSGEPAAADLVDRARRSALAAFAHQGYPLALLAERLQPERGAGRPPLVQAMLVLHRAPAPEAEALVAFALGLGGARLRLGGLKLESLDLESPGAQLDLTLSAAEWEGRFAVALNFNSDLFDPATAERLLGHFANLLRGMAAEPGRPVWELDLLSEAERRQLASWNATEVEREGEACLHELFERQAARTPGAAAVLAGGCVSTYEELNRRANQLAGCLHRLGVLPEERVGVLLDRTPDLLVGLLGVLKAGGAYVPLDPAYPRERLNLTATDAGIEVLVTLEPLAPLLSLPGIRCVRLDADREVLEREAGENLVPRARPQNLAYLIYTSGSTGRPKGVAVEHRSAVELLRWARGAFSEAELSGVLASTSVCFDLSVFELFAPLAWGGRVILAANALALPALPEAAEVTLVNTVPSAMTELAAGKLPPRLVTVNLAGEALPPQLAERIHRHAQIGRLLNLYGPSEDTTYSTWAEIGRGEARITIGRPLDNTRVHLCDRRLRPVPVGAPGELCLAGAGLARGYLGRPDLTAERFLPDPCGAPGARLYRTGDLARHLPDGRIEFLGRIDDQVKVRGFRIEPGEIETALAGYQEVREAVVVARDDLPGGRGLVAYVVPATRRPSSEDLRIFLAGKLPGHVVPDRFVLLERMPRTATGKVDRKALPAPAAEGMAFTPPRTPVEEVVAEVWADLLGRERVGAHDDFFALGGHSLLAARVVARLRGPLGVDLPLDTLFRHPTVAGLAAAAERALGSETAAFPPLERVPRAAALPLAFAQERLWFLERLTPGLPAYNLPAAVRLSGTLDRTALERAFDQVVARHEVLRTRYALAGGSPVQVVEGRAAVPLPVADLSGLPAAAAEAEALRLAGVEARRPFDLERGPVLRAALVRLSPDEHLLLLNVHHVAADGWSLRVLARDLAASYVGEVLEELPVQYADYAVWQRRVLDGPTLQAGLSWWGERLEGAPEELALPADRPRPAVQGFRGGIEPVRLPEEQVRRLRELARRQGATLFMALLAGWSALLARLADQPDVVVGTAVANRVRPELEGLIGCFVNTLPLRVVVPVDSGFGAVVERARESALGAYAHAEVPFERLIEELQPSRDLSRGSLFQVLLVLQEDPAAALRLRGLSSEPVAVHSGTAKFDLTLSLSEGERGLAGTLEYDSDLFDASTARRLLKDLEALLAADPAMPVAELPLLSGPVRAQVRLRGTEGRPESPAPAGDRPPRTQMEELVARTWEDLLGREGLDREADFFELGGHSLLAIRALSRLRDLCGVDLPVRALFERRTVAGLAAGLEQAVRAGLVAALPPLERAPRMEAPPLSFSQERLWFLERLTPGRAVYNIPAAARLSGALDRTALERAVGRIAARHEVLRTTYTAVGGSPVQVVAEKIDVSLPLVDLSGLPAPAAEAEALRLARDEAGRPFDLESGPVLRASLARLSSGDHLLVLNLHHIAADGWSLRVLATELAAFYAGRAPEELPVQYADYAVWQRRVLDGPVLEAELAWWRERLEEAPEALALPTDRTRPAVQGFRGAVEPVLLAEERVRPLRELARRQGATLFMTLLAGWSVLLERLTEQADVVVGTAVANRVRPELEGLIGFFVNTVPLRVVVPVESGFGAAVAQARETALGAYAHAEVPFERLVEELQPRRDLSRSPLFQVLLVLQEDPAAALRLPGLVSEPVAVHSGTAKFDLTLSLSERDGGLRGDLEYDSALFEASTARRLLGHLEVLLAAAAADPSLPLGDLPLLSEAERRQVLEVWGRGGPLPRPEAVGLHELFEAQARRTPESTALVWGAERLSYRSLSRRAAHVARRLRRLGVGPEVRVGVFAERTPVMVAALLGVLQAGGAYLPLDPAYPKERLAFLLSDGQAPVVLAQPSLAGLLPSYGGEVVWLNGGETDAPEGRSVCHPEQLAYVIYTSGSTGVPKGVGIRHCGAVARLAWAVEAYGERLSGVLASTSICFDLSVFELFAPLASGGTVVLAQDALALADLPAALEVRLLNTVPSAMAELVRSGAVPPSVRTVNLAGEPLRRELVSDLYELPWIEEVHNLYGPSEDTTYSAGALAGREDDGEPSIGRPLPGSRGLVLDGRGQPVPAGVAGELWLGGEGLARGYLGRPDLTAERFRPDPFPAEPGSRLYRTGDRVRWRPDGTLEFLGRLDHQVKVRGYRIEPGEVEAALAGHPGVEEVAVVAREDFPGGRGLAAYVVPAELETAVLRAWLRERLPEPMVPAVFVPLPALPRTPNGKVDRKALPRPEGSAPEPGFQAPRDPVEEAVAEVWRDLLGRERVGIHEDFFETGGHSLLAARLASRLGRTLGVDLPLRKVFEASTVARLAQVAREARQGGPGAAPPVVPVPRDGDLPLSFSQEREWLLDQLEPGTPAYNVAQAVRLRGRLDAAALWLAFDEIVRRHEVLRTSFPAVGGRASQAVASALDLSKPLVDLAALPPERRKAEARRLAAGDALFSFDLARGPLLKVTLLRLGAEEHALLLNTHHIVSDLWSIGVLLRELEALYGDFVEGREPSLPVLPVQYADYAVWQRRRLQGDLLEGLLVFWRERLQGARPPLQLPCDRPRPAVQSFRGAEVPVVLGPDLSRAAAGLARGAGASLFMTLLTAFKALVHRLSGEEDLSVGTFVANRTRPEVEPLIGFFVNTLVLRTAPVPERPFRGYLEGVREAALDAFAHQELPFEKLLEELRPERSLSHTPLFQVMFVFQNTPELEPRLPGLELERLTVETRRSNFDLTLWMWEGRDGLEGSLHYSTDLLERGTALRWTGHFRTLLAGAAAVPERALGELPLLSETEREQVLRGWSRTPASFQRDLRIHEQFAERVALTPDAAALVFDGQVLTYAALSERAGRLARALAGQGVGADVRVGLSTGRTPELVIGMLAILEAGGGFVPLDPSYPRERLAFLLEDSGAAVLLTEERLAAMMASTPPPCRAERVPAGAVAWLIYTSGSTGRPKGVAVSHANAVPLLLWCVEYFGLGPGTRVLQSLSYAFDFGVLEILTTLLAGGTLHLPGDRFGDPRLWAAGALEQGVDTVHATPSFFREVAASGARLPAVRVLHLGGEALSRSQAERLLGAVGDGCVLYNGYGPTEVTVNSLIYAARPGSWPSGEAVPIGRPSAENTAYVIDRLGQPAPPGVPGELLLGGPGVARGYHGRPKLTAERFVPDPFGGEPGARLYRSGDLVRWLPDGNVEFLGRTDHQVKVRGFRIELGEIEAALVRHPAVREAVALAREDVPGNRRLVAYVVPAGDTAPPVRALREFLAEDLPGYMVPSAFVVLESFPVTPSGKLDRRALPAPEAGQEREAYAAPRTPTEEMVAGIWAEVMGVQRVGVRDNFFELGGHSLVAAQIAARLQDAFGVEIPLRALFEGPTVEELAERVESAGASDIPPLRPVPRGRDLPLSFSQERIWFLARLDPESAAYHVPRAVWITGRLDVPALARAYGALLERHEILRTTFPEVDGRPVQRILVAEPPGAFRLPVIDLRSLPEPSRGRELERLIIDDGRRLFDLARGPMLRASLAWTGDEEHVVIQTEHHLVHDGWAEAVLLGDLLELYGASAQGRPPRLPELQVQYADFACWQRQWLQGEALEWQLAFWRSHLTGAPPLLELPTDRPRPAVLSARGGAHEVVLPGDLVRELEAVGRSHGATLFMTMLAAFETVLCRWSGQDDVVVSTSIANRRRREMEGMLGMVINTLALRTRLAGDPPIPELVRRIRETCLGAYAHQDTPFDRVVDALGTGRSLSYAPLAQVHFAFHDARFPEIDLPGLTLRPGELHNLSSKFDLTLVFRPVRERTASGLEAGGMVIHHEYSSDLFDAPTMLRLIGHYRVLLEGVVASAGQGPRLSELPLMTEPERFQLLAEWSRTAPAAGPAVCLHELVLEQARLRPDAVAVVFEGASLTYGELDRRAGRLARRLRSLGVGPEVPVALCLKRSAEMVIALLAVLRSGGAYVPIDPGYPAERRAFLLEDSGAPVLLSERRVAGELPAASALRVWLEEEDLSRGPWDPPPAGAVPEGLAYVIYTSGSTGRPKGVMVTHANVVRLFQATAPWFGFGCNDVWTLFHSYAFDFSVWEIWGALLHGGRLVVVPFWVRRSPEDFHELLVAEGVTVLNQTPSAFRNLVEVGGRGLALTEVIFGGEALDLAALEPWFELHGDAVPRLVNMYGITETTVHVTFRPVSRRDLREAHRSPLGVAIPDLRLHLLDASGNLVPLGVPAEIHVGGAGLARGYLGRPDLTAVRFVPDPLSGLRGEPGARLYRSGDLARWRPDGDLDYLGRIDSQVKIRGFRIELGEIEAALTEHPAVRQAVVVTWTLDGGIRQLAAYVVGEEDDLGTEDLRVFLGRRLPDYMVPARIVPLAELPLTPNGKVDRRALPEPEPTAGLRGTYAPPEGPVEEALAAVWAGVLGVERVGREDNFFALGGDSILSLKVVAQARERGIELSLQQIFLYQTVRDLAREVGEVRWAAPLAAMPFELISGEDRRRLPEDVEDAYPLTRLQGGMLFHSEYNPEAAVYHDIFSHHLQGRFDAAAMRQAIDRVIARHPILRTSFDLTSYGEPLQLVHGAVEIDLPVDDLRSLPPAAQEERLEAFIEAEKAHPFDWRRAPLLRFHVHLRGDDAFQFTMSCHHAILDGWSVASLTTELFRLYLDLLGGGEPPPLPEPASRFRQFVALELQTLASDESRSFWAESLEEAPATLLPRWHERTGEAAGVGTRMHLTAVPPEVHQGLQDLSRSLGMPLKSVLLAAHCRVLCALSGRKDVVTGLVANGRPEEEGAEQVLGLFLNTVPFRLRLPAGSWRDLVGSVFEAERRMLPHRCYPLADLQRQSGGPALFETAFNFIHFHAYRALSGLDGVRPLGGRFFEVNNFPFMATFALDPFTSALHLRLGYDSAVLSAAQIRAVADGYLRVLAVLAGTPAADHDRLSLSDEPERHQVLREWNDTGDQFREGTCLHQLFEEKARSTPAAEAVVGAGSRLSYGELDLRADRLARRLRASGVGPEVRVGVLLPRTPDLVTALLAVLKAGGAYVPLDPTYPMERLELMAEDSGLQVVLTAGELRGSLPEGFAARGVRVLLVDREWGGAEDGSNPQVLPGNLAYVIYTSGSTGRPKGVAIEHHSAVTLVEWARRIVGPEDLTGVLASTSISFDLSVFEIFVPLAHGGRVVLAENALELPSHPAAGEVTLVNTVPSAMNELVRLGNLPASVRVVGLAGEPLTRALADRIHAAGIGRVYNLYGPSEDTTYSTFGLVEPGSRRAPSIGRPIAGTRALLLDGGLDPVPVGVPGELYLGGGGLARGYLGRPELTAERFVPDPWGVEPGSRLYRTGDLARYLPHGEIEFLGRIDQQVKVRGFRVELGEIEAALRAEPEVRDATVVAQTGPDGDRRLVAFAVGGADLDGGALRQRLGRKLPAYMVPSACVVLKELPLTPSGKVDRRALSAMETVSEQTFVAPRNPVEELVAGIWAETLGRKVGVHDHFFEVGGHSLSAVRVAARLRKALGIDLQLRQLFETPTVASLAVALTGPELRERVERTASLTLLLAAMSEEEVESMLAAEDLVLPEGDLV